MAGDTIRINGNPYSWASTSFYVGNQRYYGLTNADWDEKREHSLVYGMTRAHGPRGMTSGKYTPGTLKVGVTLDTALAIKRDMAAMSSDGKNYGSVAVPIFIQAVEPGLPVVNEVFDFCMLQSAAHKKEESVEATKEDLEFAFLHHHQNSLALYDTSSEGL